jgi:hypothetical protein
MVSKMKREWPDFFIIGAPRSGTTSLHEYLNQISEIFMCTKESGYFSKFSIGRVKTEREYKSLYNNSKNNQLIGDATPDYLRDPETPSLIYKANPKAKIIILLRDPIERTHSHYLKHIRNGYETKPFSKRFAEYKDDTRGSFHDYIIMPSFYFDSVSKYINVFGDEQIKICIYEEFAKNTKKIVREILDFLQIDSDLPSNINKKYNEFAHPPQRSEQLLTSNYFSLHIAKRFLPKSTRSSIKNLLSDKNSKPELEENDIIKLHKLFDDDVTKLQNLLKRKLNWKHFPNTF